MFIHAVDCAKDLLIAQLCPYFHFVLTEIAANGGIRYQDELAV